MYTEYTDVEMQKIARYEADMESNKQERRGKGYVNLNQSIFKLQYDEDFMALAYSTVRIF